MSQWKKENTNKKLSSLLTHEADCKAPNDTQIQSPTTVTVPSCYDVREIVSLCGLEKLSSHKKYSILKNHFKAAKLIFSEKFISMVAKGLAKLNTFVVALYIAKTKRAVYVINCALFSPTDKQKTLGSFANTGDKGWKYWY